MMPNRGLDKQTVRELDTHCSVCGSRLQWQKKSIIELSFKMSLTNGKTKLHISKIWRLEHAAAHAMGYIKLRSVLTDMTDRIKK